MYMLTDADGPAPLELPNQWLWDIIDEFIYQVMLCNAYVTWVCNCKWCDSEKEITFSLNVNVANLLIAAGVLFANNNVLNVTLCRTDKEFPILFSVPVLQPVPL